jgi:hypothetical protein
MKTYACKYVDANVADLWEGLVKYNAANTYDEFKAEVYHLYPRSAEEKKYSKADLDKLITDQLRIGIRNLEGLGNYFRSFIAITNYLKRNTHLSEEGANEAFVKAFWTELWDLIV